MPYIYPCTPSYTLQLIPFYVISWQTLQLVDTNKRVKCSWPSQITCLLSFSETMKPEKENAGILSTTKNKIASLLRPKSTEISEEFQGVSNPENNLRLKISFFLCSHLTLGHCSLLSSSPSFSPTWTPSPLPS